MKIEKIKVKFPVIFISISICEMFYELKKINVNNKLPSFQTKQKKYYVDSQKIYKK